MKYLAVLISALMFFVSDANAQNIISNGTVVPPSTISTSNNLIQSGVGAWSNTVTGQAGGTVGGPTPAYNPSTNTIIFSYTQQSVAQTIAVNQALQNSGIAVLGYNYSWVISNYGQQTGSLTGVVSLNGINSAPLQQYTYSYGLQPSDLITYSGTQMFGVSYPISAISSLSVTWTGMDNKYWAGYWGPRVRDPSISAIYGTDICQINPLNDPSCAGYQAAYATQQCRANPLFSTACPGYAVAYQSQQCSANPLYATTCPGYQQAYYNQQCSANPLYATTCPGYQQAYETKQIVNQQTTPAPVTPTITTTVTAVQQATTVPTTTSPTSVTSVTSVIAAPSTTSATGVTSLTSISTTQSTTTSSSSSTTSTTTTTTSSTTASAPEPKDEKKAAVAVEKVKTAKTMEEQVVAQGAVLKSMAYVPGFTAYQNSIVPDINQIRLARMYSKPPVDNNRTQRLLGGAQERKWEDMVDAQYKLGE